MANILTTLVASGDGLATLLPDGPGLLTAGRTELKYCVPGPISEVALDVARGHLVPDALALGPRQPVTSLYLDTPHLTFLRWHRQRAVDRFKLRIRRYGDHPATMLYAEVKRKTGSIVRKRRAAFTVESLQGVLEGSRAPHSEASPDGTDDLKEFIRRRSQCGATPRMLVTCIRESLRDPREGTAVTVDCDLRYQPTRRGDLIGDGRAWRPIRLPSAFGAATALVELKYTVEPPPWMEALIVQFAPWRVSFSKYAAAMSESAPAEIR